MAEYLESNYISLLIGIIHRHIMRKAVVLFSYSFSMLWNFLIGILFPDALRLIRPDLRINQWMLGSQSPHGNLSTHLFVATYVTPLSNGYLLKVPCVVWSYAKVWEDADISDQSNYR